MCQYVAYSILLLRILVLDKIYVEVIKPIKLKLSMQYVDDSWAIIKKDKSGLLHEALNDFDNNLIFTYEKEVNNSISFLNIKIIRNGEQLKTDLFVKESKSNRMLNYKSFQPLQNWFDLWRNWKHRQVVWRNL